MAQFFRTATPMGDWRSFKFTHAEQGVVYYPGLIYLIEDTVGVLFLDIQYDAYGNKVVPNHIDEGDEGVLVYEIEKVIVDKVTTTGSDFLPGDKVYWSGVQGDPVTNSWSSGYYWIGIATEPADDDDCEVEIDLLGNKATVGA